jgi:hypothetical protein
MAVRRNRKIMHAPFRAPWLLITVALCGRVDAQESRGDSSAKELVAKRSADDRQSKVLTADEWRRLDVAIDRALDWLVTQQQPDGSFPTLERGQPGVTSLCVLAFMAHGHSAGEGKYGHQLDRAAEFIIGCQKQNGLITRLGPEGPRITQEVANEIGEPAAYNHAIGSLTLSEMYGMGQPTRTARLKQAIEKSLVATLEMQRWPKDLPVDGGGWRYVTDDGVNDSDLSITGWQLMFLRSSRNAGFHVPQPPIDDAVAYVRRTFNAREGTFGYVTGLNTLGSRAMAGAGILALAHAGRHHSTEAERAGQWLLEHPFDEYNGGDNMLFDRYHYSLFNACQGMYQLGSPYWERFFPRVVATMLAHQNANGSWDAESLQRDRPFGNSYTTALSVLALGAPNQFLPVFQR